MRFYFKINDVRFFLFLALLMRLQHNGAFFSWVGPLTDKALSTYSFISLSLVYVGATNLEQDGKRMCTVGY